MRFDIITIFPSLFESFVNESLIKKAIQKKLLNIGVHDLRTWAYDRHKTVDDSPYGGGPGMVMKFEPFAKALAKLKATRKTKGQKIVMLDPAGKQFTQATAERWSKVDRIVFLCGRYEGFDHRITKLVDERVSVGPYVLNGGEVPTMAIMEAISRLIPGFIGNKNSLNEETFSKQLSSLAEYPHYTRPETIEWRGKKMRVPKILLSGDPKKVTAWRTAHVKH
ncbi:MAG: tRNA (guanosine(37)-N1)-methyltransferase TrmD [bacterium]|nr:tRNA (guanosine(37)-N1)-methyltransferase TrmD [bacterium]